MKVWYLRAEDGSLRGCVLRREDGRYGYSLIHPNDRRKASKKLARTIAEGRAEKVRVVAVAGWHSWIQQRNGGMYRPVPGEVARALTAMDKRVRGG